MTMLIIPAHFIQRTIMIAIMVITTLPWHANAIEVVRGKPIQGGMVIVKTAPGFSMTADGEPLMVTKDGFAVIGFHRDDTDKIVLESFSNGAPAKSLSIIPDQRHYKEQRINGLPKKMVTPPEDVLARIKRDRDVVGKARMHKTTIPAFLDAFDWPVHGIITGVYGSRRILNNEPRAPHYGIDIAAPTGTSVMAPQSGVIRMVEDLYYTGWTIIIDHGHGISSTFLHLDKTTVNVGDTIQKGDVIGTVGSTGRSTGPHLDWRVNWFSKRLDPSLLVGPMPKS